MKPLIPLLAAAGFLIQTHAIATMNHPEEAYPDDVPLLVSLDGPYTDFFKQIQQKLHDAGFDAGPVNGNFGIKTQTALGQFQQSQGLPVSGMTDARTLLVLGVERPDTSE